MVCAHKKRSISSLRASDPSAAKAVPEGESSASTTPAIASERAIERARSTTSLSTCRSWPSGSERKFGSMRGASKTFADASFTLPRERG